MNNVALVFFGFFGIFCALDCWGADVETGRNRFVESFIESFEAESIPKDRVLNVRFVIDDKRAAWRAFEAFLRRSKELKDQNIRVKLTEILDTKGYYYSHLETKDYGLPIFVIGKKGGDKVFLGVVAF